jgi:hypothetical protein
LEVIVSNFDKLVSKTFLHLLIFSFSVGFYILLRAVDRFVNNYNRLPGVFDRYFLSFTGFSHTKESCSSPFYFVRKGQLIIIAKKEVSVLNKQEKII